RQIKITTHSVSETAHHASKGYYSTLAAIDAPQQLRTARINKTVKLKGNRRERDMKLKVKKIGSAKHNRAKTKIVLGTTTSDVDQLYCITSTRDKPHKKKNRQSYSGLKKAPRIAHSSASKNTKKIKTANHKTQKTSKNKKKHQRPRHQKPRLHPPAPRHRGTRRGPRGPAGQNQNPQGITPYHPAIL
ncbi:MAG: hypothetical protein IJ764_06260, partial [Bacteroidales bacterium]|nr:hypothetical protein [Bacteroidales bacterium]